MHTPLRATTSAAWLTLFISGGLLGQTATIDTRADSWTAIDGLGRRLPGHEQVGPRRADKYVGMFYFLWMGQHHSDGPYDVTRILSLHPGAMTQPADPLWGPQGHFHHWGEPLFGYYLSDDAWVFRKHAQMLADADIDVIIFDVTNQATYPKSYTALCEAFTAVRRNGGRTPQIAFLTPFGDPAKVVAALYKDLYEPGRYKDLWFIWKGKPLVMADPDKVAPELRSFFTFRKPQPDYFQGPTGPDQWGWLEIHPQHVFRNAAGEPEQMTVGVAQNSTDRRCCAFSEKNTRGRSWHADKKDDRPDAVDLGLNFAEQWEHALKVDPQFIFITGWNEWIALRLPEFAGVREPVMLVDQYTQEYSRDIEPMKGGHFDHYYYQMLSNIRRFKGVRPAPKASGPKTIRIDAQFDDWHSIQPEYRDDRGDTYHRDHPGYDNVGRYINTTGRNDLVLTKVAADAEHVAFYARTTEPLTAPNNDPDWMVLLIRKYDLTRKSDSYDLCIRPGLKDGHIQIAAAGNQLELAVPRTLLAERGTPLRLEFKWADNTGGDPTGFIVNGDTAPNQRFAYRFEE